MKFTEPYGLLLLGFVLLFVVLMSRALRRRTRSVSSFYLISDVLDSLPLLPRSFLLRKRFQMILFLAAVALAALAAAGPLAGPPSGKPVQAVIVLDHLSHWSDARLSEAGWESVIDKARSVIKQFRRDDGILLVRTDSGAVKEGFVSPGQAASLAGKLPPSEKILDLEAAADNLRLIDAAHRPDFVAIVTPFPSRWRDVIADGDTKWHLVPSSPPPPPGINLALLNVEIRHDILRPDRFSLFCRLGAYSPDAGGEPVEAALSVKWNDKELFAESLSLRPGMPKSLALPDLTAGDGLLSITLGPLDSFPDDNTYLTPIRSRPFLETGLVTRGNHALESALRAVPGLTLAVTEPGSSPPGQKPLITVYDGFVPDTLEGNALVIRPFRGMPGLGVKGEAARPATVSADEFHPLLEGVSLDTLEVRNLPVFFPGPLLRTVAKADGYPLLLAGRSVSGDLLAVMGFDPVASGWIYDPSFPILIANIVSWLGMESPSYRSSFVVGDTLSAGMLGEAKTMTGPTGEVHRLRGENSAGFTFPLAGRYGVEGRAKESPGEIFVNLLDEEVSRSMASGRGEHGESLPPFRAGLPFRLEMMDVFLIVSVLLLLLEILIAPSAQVGRLPE